MRRVGHVYGEGVDRFSGAMDRVWHRLLATDASTTLLAIRLAFGIIFFAHGTQKLFGWFGGAGLSASGAGLEAMGYSPGVLVALLVGLIEIFGGLMLLVGVGTRIAAALLGITQAVAMLTVHWKHGFFLGGPEGNGIEYNLALIAGLLAAFVHGGGAGSLDRTIWKRWTTRRKQVM